MLTHNVYSQQANMPSTIIE